MDKKQAVKEPVLDESKTDQEPVLDESKTKQEPVLDESKTDQEPVLDDGDDDLSENYLARREERVGASAVDDLDAAFSAPEEPATAPKGGEPAEKTIGQKAISVAKDVGEGVFIEAAGQIVGGVMDAVNETSDLTFELADWLNKNVADFGQVVIDEDGIRWAKGTPKENAIQAPTTGEADSVTGGFIRNISQFVTGFVGAGKVLKPFKKFQDANKFTQAMVKGAAADFTVFDAHEDRLSNLVQEVPALQNPVTEFLSASPDDNAAVGRLKNAVEGMGLGVALDGFVTGLKIIRSNRVLKEVANVASDAAPAQVTKPDLSILGDVDSDKLILSKTKAAVRQTKDISADELRATDDSGEVTINFARIDTPDDVKKIIQQSANAMKKNIDSGRRGVRSHEVTKLSAEKEDAWKILSDRRKGEALNAEESVAVRNLWVASGEKLAEVAKQAAGNPSVDNLYAFRKMLATHHTIQREVIAARTETARALNSWRITAEGDAMMARQLEDLLEQSGGKGVAQDMAERISKLVEQGKTRELEAFVEKGVLAKTGDAVAQAWINGLLSNPTTHVVNFVSNWSVIGQQMAERKIASHLSQALGTRNGVEIGEATAMINGMLQGFKESLRISSQGRRALGSAAKKAARGDLAGAKKEIADKANEFGSVYNTAVTGEVGHGMNKVELPRQGSLSSETWNVASDTAIGRSLDFIDSTTQIPGRMLATSDEFFKSMGYRMEVHAQSVRMAAAEVRDGKLAPSDVKKRVAELVENPPDTIKLRSIDAATYQTFTRKSENLPKKIADAVQSAPILGRLILPFKNTPINIMMYTFERTPLAPLIKEWRDDIAAGGAKADIALTRMATGTMIMGAAVDLAMSGHIIGEGPTEPGEKANFNRQNRQNYSAKIGGKWVSFSRMDPLGMTIGLGADMFAIIRNSQESDEEIEKAFTATMFAVAKNVTSKTYLQSISALFDAISDPDRYGDGFAQKMAGSVVPAGVAAISRIEDPHMRVAQDMVEAIKRRTPWWNQDLPLYRDLWGRTISYKSDLGTAYDLLSPAYVKTENPEPIDTELERIGYFPQNHSRKMSINGVAIDLSNRPHIFDRYSELAGNGVKHPAWNKGAKDYLNDVVSGNNAMSPVFQMYSDGPDGGKAMFIRKVIEAHRELAKDQIMKEFPELQADYDIKRGQAGKLNPNIVGPLTLK